MRFNSLEEFLKYFYENNVNIVDVEFNVTPTSTEEPAVNPDVVEEPVEEPTPEEEPQKLEETTVTLRLASGNVNVVVDTEGYMLVDDFSMTPNACGVGSIVVEGRHLQVNMCEMDGKTVAYLHTLSGQNDAVAVRRKK